MKWYQVELESGGESSEVGTLWQSDTPPTWHTRTHTSKETCIGWLDIKVDIRCRLACTRTRVSCALSPSAGHLKNGGHLPLEFVKIPLEINSISWDQVDIITEAFYPTD